MAISIENDDENDVKTMSAIWNDSQNAGQNDD